MKKILVIFSLIISFFVFNLKVNALEDGIYVIHSAIDDNYVLDANGGKAASGTNISLWYKNSNNNQKWYVKKITDDYYEIKSLINENYNLDANGGVFSYETNIQLWKSNNGNAQKWKIKESKNGYYQIYSYDNNYSLDAYGAVAKSGTNIGLWKTNDSLAQKFRFEKITKLEKTIEAGVYTISSSLSNNLNVDVYGGIIKDNVNIQLYNAHNKEGQKYYVTYLNDGYYSIRGYLDINYALTVNSKDNIEMSKYSNLDSQKWIISKNDNGNYNIISKKNFKAMDVNGGTAKSGVNISAYNYHNNLNQQFNFNPTTIQGSKDIDNGYYIINISSDSKKVLDVNNGVMQSGRNVEIYNLNYGINQKWYIEYLENGYYKILCNKDSNYALQMDGENVNIGVYNNLDSQLWIIKKSNDGYYIMSKTGKYMDLYYGNLTNGTNIQGYSFNGEKNQRYNFIKTADGVSQKVLENGIYRISSALDSNKFVDVNGAYKKNGTNVQLWSRNASVAQKWNLEYIDKGYYKITSLVDLTKSLDVEYASLKAGTNVSIYSYSNSAMNQQWIIKDAGDGYYNIVSNCNGLYLDVANGSTQNGANILMWNNNGGINQKFKFIKSEKETRVIDVSAHQGKIDWDKVSQSGIYGVILRIGFWSTEDARFSEYISEVKRLDIPYGIYIFSYANTTNGANVEAEFTKTIFKKYNLNPTLGIFYDLEDWYIAADNTSNTLSKSQYDDIAKTFINNVSSYVGSNYKVKLYADLNHANNRFGSYARSQVDWIAQYNKTGCTFTGNYTLWQYSSGETLSGINGYVDMSYMR